jgi:hypothetical protein
MVTTIDPLADWWVHTVTVQPLTGHGPEGDTYGTAYEVIGYLDHTRRLVRAANGSQVVSNATLLAPIATADIPVGSLVSSGATRTKVITFTRHEAGPQPTPNHVEMFLE